MIRFTALSLAALVFLAGSLRGETMPPATRLSVTDYPSIQEAIDANPGKMMFVPSGDYEITQPITITTDNSGLFGFGRIIQTDPMQSHIVVSDAAGVRLHDVTLLRPEGQQGNRSAVRADRARNLVLKGLQVLDNRAPTGAINIQESPGLVIRDCLVRNYVAVTTEDRTASPEQGFAYKALDGTGIQTVGCVGVLITGNRVIQSELLPTEETQAKFDLGRFTKKNAQKGELVSQDWWDQEMSSNWNQGSSITINGSSSSDYVLACGNYIENGAQGFDVQSDHTTLANNITVNAVLGMKAMHGSRNTLVVGNQFSRCDINGVLLQPGIMSHAAAQPSRPEQKPDANVDGGSIVANNIVSDFGYGTSHWIWGPNRWPFEFSRGQMPDDPPLRDVIVQGNILYDKGRDGILIDGKPVVVPPKYSSAVWVNPDETQGRGPVNVLFFDNIFHPGRNGTLLPASFEP